MEIKTVKMIEEREWSAFVSKTYGRLYRLQQQNGCYARQLVYITAPNEDAELDLPDTVPEIVNGKEMGVNFNAWLARDPAQKIEGRNYDFELTLWWHRNFYPPVEAVANDLYKRGLLPAGDYVININW